MPGSYPSQNSPQYYERDVVPEWPRRSRPPVQKNDQFAGKRRSTGRRMVRTLVRFTIAILIGIAGTLAWQSHGISVSIRRGFAKDAAIYRAVIGRPVSFRSAFPLAGWARSVHAIVYGSAAPSGSMQPLTDKHSIFLD
jgi:hypothetical protein